jgi:hypothetical protein
VTLSHMGEPNRLSHARQKARLDRLHSGIVGRVASALYSQMGHRETVRKECKLRTVIKRGPRFHMAKSHLRVVAPTEVKRTVAPKRQKNTDLRTREHLTLGEVETLLEAARGNRHGHRDATMILLTYRD